MDSKKKQYLKVKEVADMLGTNRDNIYKYLKSGILQGRRYGKGDWQIEEDWVIEFKNQCTNQTHTSKNNNCL